MDNVVSEMHVYDNEEKHVSNAPHSQRWSLFIFISVGVFVAIGAFMWARWNQSKISPMSNTSDQAPRVSVTPVQTGKLTTLSVGNSVKSADASYVSIPIGIDTGLNTVSGVELHIVLSPIPNQIVQFVEGDFFDSSTILKNRYDGANGSITVAVSSITPKQGSGVIGFLQIPISKSQPQSTFVRITENTKVAAVHEEGSVVKELQSNTIVL